MAERQYYEILIIDDEPVNLKLLADILNGQNYEVRMTINGRLGIAAVEADAPDLILLDVMLPDMSGYEVCKTLKKNPNLASIPIIFLSALDNLSNKMLAFEAGASDYITKPFYNVEVLARVETYVKRHVLEKQLKTWGEQLEVQVRQRTAELEEALRREKETRDQLILAGKLSALGQMVATIAHELNNPLQTIRNCLYLLRDNVTVNEQVQLYLDLSLSEIQRLADLVGHLRQVYRPSKNDIFEPVNIVTLLQDVHKLTRSHLRQKHVNWEPSNLQAELLVNGQRDHLLQVLMNIVLNGAESMQPDGGDLRVELLLSASQSQIGIQISDTGCGIPPEDLDRVFDPFFTTRENGMGLGLAISYDIVRKHDGRIAIKSTVDVGTTFTVWLPRWVQ
jgi:signal transduction histidine kinase